MDDGLRMVEVGACSAWPLPGDPTCAGVARRLFRRAAAGLVLEPGLVDDGVTMVSELAANTLHVPRGHAAQPRPRATPELWLYLRGRGQRRELVCKVFDSFPGWLRGNVPGRGNGRAPADALSGRGLEVVHELSQGRWGHHPTRSRLAGWEVRGKAVWFSVPAPAPDPAPATAPATATATAESEGQTDTAPPDRYAWMSASQAMTELETGLAARGFGGRMVRAGDQRADMAVLSVCSGVTVWCRSGVAWLRAPGTAGRQWNYSDLVEVAEQTVQAFETLASEADQQRPLADATAGTLMTV
jgi:hypothetical protein